MAYSVGEVAKLAHVSVRTLHHYDAIGLLKPSERSGSGYRKYTDRDLERLQEILFYRELGFPLDAIARMTGDPRVDRREALVAQRALLEERLERTRAVLALVDRTIASIDGGTAMTKEEMFEVFGDFDPAAYEAEAKERWGKTDAYAESARRTKSYTKEDWKRMRAELDAIEEAYAQALDAGESADEPSVADIAERHRQHIDRWFYPCSKAMHASLGEMYVADARFAEHYDGRRPGLAKFVRDAIVANAAR